jgi:hypothetical protein
LSAIKQFLQFVVGKVATMAASLVSEFPRRWPFLLRGCSDGYWPFIGRRPSKIPTSQGSHGCSAFCDPWQGLHRQCAEIRDSIRFAQRGVIGFVSRSVFPLVEMPRESIELVSQLGIGNHGKLIMQDVAGMAQFSNRDCKPIVRMPSPIQPVRFE